MKATFLGSGEFSRDLLRHLLRNGFVLTNVITRADRPAGRGLKPSPTPLRVFAEDNGLRIFLPGSPHDPDFMSALNISRPDLLLVADYGMILPRKVLRFPPRGCVNVHPSLLPSYRGAAPIQRAIMCGESVTGVTLMEMDEGMDTGAVIARQEAVIGEDDDAHSLREKLALLGAHMVLEYIPRYLEGAVEPTPQDNEAASYADPITKSELAIDWERDARAIRDQVRGLSPRPGAHTFLRGRRVKIIKAGLREDVRGLMPAVMDVPEKDVLLVGTGSGALQPHTLQPEGKKAISAAEFIRGYRIRPGEALA